MRYYGPQRSYYPVSTKANTAYRWRRSPRYPYRLYLYWDDGVSPYGYWDVDRGYYRPRINIDVAPYWRWGSPYRRAPVPVPRRYYRRR